MVQYRFIDSDTHISEPADVWTARLPAKWRDRGPNVRWVEADASKGQRAGQYWFLGDQQSFPVGLTTSAGWGKPFPSCPMTYEEMHPASWQIGPRLAYMDSIGCWAQVLYPNIGGFGNQFFLKLGDPELMLACVQAFNDFQQEWTAPAPDRFVTPIAVPFWDIDATVKEVERCAAKGFRTVLFTMAPQDFGQPYIGDRQWDRLWSVAQEAELPISFHIGTGDMGDMFSAARVGAHGMAPTYAYSSSVLFLNNGIQLADLLLSGVLPRFPNLKFVSVESGIGWIPFVLETVDYQSVQVNLRAERPEFTLKPSDYFRRQVYGCYWFEKQLDQVALDAIGTDNILFETDFPHPTSLYAEEVARTIDTGIGRADPALRRKVLIDNAAKLYRLNVPEPALAA